MKFIDLVQARYSVRSYKPDPVEDEKLQYVLEAARLAPTAANLQPFVFIVVHVRGREAELRQICKPEWFVQAPMVICICNDPSKAWKRQDGKHYGDVDAAIAMDHLTLAAAEQGLGTCWIARFDPSAARDVLRLPDNLEPVVFTPLGYPGDSPGAKKRKLLADLVRYEHH